MPAHFLVILRNGFDYIPRSCLNKNQSAKLGVCIRPHCGYALTLGNARHIAIGFHRFGFRGFNKRKNISLNYRLY